MNVPSIVKSLRLSRIRVALVGTAIVSLLAAGCTAPQANQAPASAGAPVQSAAMNTPMPMDHSGHDMHHMPDMGAGGMMSHTMPMSPTMPMSHTVPMAMCQDGMCEEHMTAMHSLMEQMKTATPKEHAQLMQHMMAMMQGMMDGMDGMDMSGMCQDGMCDDHMAAMHSLMEQMKTATPAEQEQLMAQMMTMMQGMMDSMPMDHSGHGMGNMPGMGAGSMMTPTMPMSPTMPMNHDSHTMAVPSKGVPAATVTVGGQPLTFTVENGVKVFQLTAAPVRWPLLDGVQVTAWAYNGSVPGPMIRVTEGDAVRIILQNTLPESTSIHWHGMRVPNAMDGMTEIKPGSSFTYEFTAPAAGSYMYHSHIHSDRQVGLGLYAPFIVDPKAEATPPDVDVSWMLSEWRIGADGETYPAMPMAGMEPNYFTINGKSYPDIPMIEAKLGQRVRVRLANVGQLVHPMHLHGMNFTVVAYDGVALPPAQQMVRNTIAVNPGELVDIEIVADAPGEWMFHCHVLHHLTNDGVEPGGLLTMLRVTE